ncbi:efflux RND transporter periplasmic adaptor subunit [Inquilinus limosus]|uniref:efflux RND transporter periplasmic adaptor subunit n=1 Tax=Inquilinus limosus TaxID=171674 RepID=UPI003F168A39
MKRSVLGIVAVLGIAVAAVAWQRFGNADAIERSGKTAETGGAGQPGSKNAGRAIPVATAPVQQKSVATTLSAIGTVEPISTVQVSSRIDSQVMQVHVADGQTVQAGDLLFTLDDKPPTAQVALAQANLAKDQAMRDQAAADVERDRPLVKTGAVSQQAYEQAVATAKAAEATVAADQASLDQAQLTLSYTQIRAPITGRLGVVAVTAGNLVKANGSSGSSSSSDSGTAATGLVTITQMTPIRIAFTVPERNLDAVRAAMAGPTPPKVDAFSNDGKTHLATGTLTFVNSTVDTKSGTIPLKATFGNTGQALWPGQFVQVSLTLGTQQDAVTVPTVALQAGQDGAYVFVARPDGTAEQRPVTVARTNGDEAVIAQGLKPGEQVVTEGQLRLMQGSRIAVRGSGGAPAANPA